MREIRLSGSEGGATFTQSSLPLSIIQSLRDRIRHNKAVPQPETVEGQKLLPFR